MSHDNSQSGPETPEALPDEGTIHEWLDGQLDEEQAARLERLVHTSPEFAATVAEARGLVAGSSRVLLALDGVPSGVVPSADQSADQSTVNAGGRPSRVTRSTGLPWRRWGAVAALLMVGVTGVAVLQRAPQREPQPAREPALAEMEEAASEGAMVASPMGASPMGASPMGARSAPASTAASADAASADTASADIAPGESVAAARAARAASRSEPESLVSPARRTAERVAAVKELRPGIEPLAAAKANAAPRRARAMAPGLAPAAPPAPSVAADAADAARSADRPGATADAGATAETPAEFASDLPPEELAFAVQRVSCAPTCTQQRDEIARDGRVRRFTRATLLGAARVDSGATVSAAALQSLQQLADSLGLADLPATLALDGGRCRSLSALRESLRVEFVVDGQRRSVMGLPWCSDGSHPMDQVARAVADAVGAALAKVSRP